MANSSRLRAVALTTTAVLLSAVLAGCGDGAKDEDLTAQKLDWKDCPAPSEAEGGGSAPSPLPNGTKWQCATMRAPLDWSRPKGDTIGIALIRAEASGPANKRIGSLVFNFGGPGGSGVTTLPAFGADYGALHTRYDLVSFDPRGVGRSAPVECESDAQLDEYFQQDATPEDGAERTQLLERTKRFNAACEKNSEKILPHVRTTDAARDMDLMRQVLGDRKLHYFGISYGTELGGVYAHLFPKNVGRAVFDAVVDPTQTPEQSALGQAKGFQLALDNFAKDCTSKTTDCPIGDTEQEVKDRIAKLLADLEKKPIPGIFPRELTQTAATSGIAQSLYSKDFWEYLTEGLEEAYDGDGKILMLLSDSMNGRNENGEYSNLTAANLAINCSDEKPRYTTDHVLQKLPEFRAASPLFGEYLAWGMVSCTDWAVPGAADHPDVSAPGAAPILVIGNTGDPATPYEGARKMVGALGKGVGIELTYKGQGHGAYDSKNKCVQGAVNGYLLDGKLPRGGTVCS
ncbi:MULTISPECIES: alpha/beta hydrolase [Streptomyces]|uniref:Alpha/beta hydrolase n=2 Tax=Streptomyces TaxID=1883 RepID=A0ABS9JJP4_9ACTN|nr:MULTISPECIES: alpha/beta hydrolase [Streptomyces]MCG0065777.1 alpha/beta hydrolase [Streptomyces tricolor]MYU29898.1 alpha/beta fold hydrolase [Streptomyces sp. SID7810]BCM69326.1 putative tripeptidyl-peptidase C, secreted [Streptomyces sp. EAS-AB2608]CUW30957.1 Carboxylesterase A precursor [Streptomyces reticuli]